jgi:hypothetical protein
VALKVGGPCETTRGKGTVLSVDNATRWRPAWLLVRLDTGETLRFGPLDVWPPKMKGGDDAGRSG